MGQELIKLKQIEPITANDIPVEVRDKNYVHNQNYPSDSWNIKHDMNKKPSVQIFDNDSNEYEADKIYIDSNNVEIKLEVSISGFAILN